MSSPIAIPRPTKANAFAASSTSSSSSYSSVASSSSSPATSYSPSTQTKGLYVPVHKRSPSPPRSPTVESQNLPQSRTYSIHQLLALRAEAHAHGYTDSMKAKLRAGPAPELVMNRKMRKNLEFAEHHHRRVSPTSSVNVSPVSKASPLPPVTAAPVSPVLTQAPTAVKSKSEDVHHSRDTRTKFSGRSSHPEPHPQTSERKRQPFGGLHSNLANWRSPAPPRLAVN